MTDINKDDVQKLLERLKEHTEQTVEEKTDTQTTDNSIHSDEDIKNMLKKHFSADESVSSFETGEDYSFETVDFGRVDDEIITSEIVTETAIEEADEEVTEEASKELIEENSELDGEELSNDVVDQPEEETITEEYEEENPDTQTVEKTWMDEIFASAPEEASEKETESDQSESEEAQDPYADEAKDEVEDVVSQVTASTEEEIIDDIVDEIVEQTLAAEDEQISADEEDENFEAEAEVEVEAEAEAEAEVEEEAEAESATAETEVQEIIETTLFEPAIEDIAEENDDIPVSDETPIDISEPTEESYEESIAEQSIDYDEVLEGQQGTVFNEFVEDFSGDLEDVVFEAEITESRAPDKQYTIFEDWERLMKDKSYETAEDGIIPPTEDELARSAEISQRASGNTDYFNPVTSADLDAVDIALMVALGGESELNQTVGFEKIRQAVHEDGDKKEDVFKNKKIYGFCGEEYRSLAQNADIKKKYKSDKKKIIAQLISTAILALVLLVYELTGWVGYELPFIFSIYEHPDIYVLAGLQLAFLCAVISYNKFSKLFKRIFDFSSITFIAAIITLILNILHDALILSMGYVDPNMTFHSFSSCLLALSLLYDIFDVLQQRSVFGYVATSEKKLVLEPYGKLRVDENDDSATGEIIDNDSYCISRVPSVTGFFEHISKSPASNMGRLVSVILSCSVALCVMIVLLIMGEQYTTFIPAFIVTLSFALICSSVFESEFAYFTVYRALKKHKTGIIGKSSVSEYGKCNIIYFDDYNVFNKKSVRTKGLKLYDNNEIYRVLYHTQAVFSKVGGPLKAVFEFATSEMVHSKSVEIKDIGKDGIVALVDGKTLVHIGTGAFMKSRGIHPSYTAADVRVEERGEESIMFIALGGKLGAKLYVTYQFSAEFEKLARKLAARGISIGIRSCDPNVNNKWAKRYSSIKKLDISIVRPTLKEMKPAEKSIDGGIVSAKNVRALTEALMMCVKLDRLEALFSKMRVASIVLVGILSFALMLFSGINTVSMLALILACALCASVMMLLTHFYIKR